MRFLYSGGNAFLFSPICTNTFFIDLDDTLWDFHANARLSLQDMFEDRKLYRLISKISMSFLTFMPNATLNFGNRTAKVK